MMPKTCRKDPTASGTAGPYSSNSFPVMIPENNMKNTAFNMSMSAYTYPSWLHVRMLYWFNT